MKILMLGWELPPHNSGGLGVACYHLCKALSHRGVSIEFVLPYHADHEIDFMNIHAAQPHDVAHVQSSGIAYDSYLYEFKDGHSEIVSMHDQLRMYEAGAAKLAEELEFDVIHAHDWLTFRAALRVRERKNRPLILHLHSIEADRAGGNSGNPLVREIEQMALLVADKVIAVSEHTKKAIMREYGIPGDKIDVAHNSIDASLVAPLDGETIYRHLEKLKGQGYRVVTNIGRLTTQKGLPNLLLAAQKVVKHYPKTIFLIVGSGEQYFELIEQAAALGISRNVIFTGFQRGKNWRDSFGIADLFVMPSVSEPFGLTPLEAIGYGTPSLVSKQSGVSEVLRNCLKVDYWDVDEMANKIVAVMRSDALRDEILTNAFKEFEHMSWHPTAQKIHGLYESHMAGATA